MNCEKSLEKTNEPCAKSNVRMNKSCVNNHIWKKKTRLFLMIILINISESL